MYRKGYNMMTFQHPTLSGGNLLKGRFSRRCCCHGFWL